jgi:hypothetical protein
MLHAGVVPVFVCVCLCARPPVYRPLLTHNRSLLTHNRSLWTDCARPPVYKIGFSMGYISRCIWVSRTTPAMRSRPDRGCCLVIPLYIYIYIYTCVCVCVCVCVETCSSSLRSLWFLYMYTHAHTHTHNIIIFCRLETCSSFPRCGSTMWCH